MVLHGLFGMLDNWQSHGKIWAAMGYRVHLIDQRNHGRSFHSREHSYDNMSDDLEDYMDHHGIDSAVVLGHSMGGKTAMKFACEHEDRVDKLIVVDIAPRFYPTHHDEIIRALNSVDFEKVSTRKEVQQILEPIVGDAGTVQFLMKSLHWAEPGKLAYRFNLPVLEEQIENIGEALPAQSEYHGPVLFVKGGDSGYIASNDAENIRSHFPEASIETIDHAGHWVHAQKAADFSACVNAFLEK